MRDAWEGEKRDEFMYKDKAKLGQSVTGKEENRFRYVPVEVDDSVCRNRADHSLFAFAVPRIQSILLETMEKRKAQYKWRGLLHKG